MKYLYALISNSNDYFAEQLLISVFSLKYYNPSAFVSLLTDKKTYESLHERLPKILDDINEVIIVPFESNFSNIKRSRMLKTNSRNYVKGDFLFLDTDTIITGPVDESDFRNVNFGAVHDFHEDKLDKIRYKKFIYSCALKLGWDNISGDMEYFNSGVFWVKDTELNRQFFKKWNKNWLSGTKYNVISDQPSLGMTYASQKIISELSPFLHCQILGNGLRYLVNAKIIHYFNTSKSKLAGKYPLKIMDIEFLNKIKTNKQLTSDEIKVILNIKSEFAEDIEFVTGNQIVVVNSNIFKLIGYIYRKFRPVYNFIDNILER